MTGGIATSLSLARRKRPAAKPPAVCAAAYSVISIRRKVKPMPVRPNALARVGQRRHRHALACRKHRLLVVGEDGRRQLAQPLADFGVGGGALFVRGHGAALVEQFVDLGVLQIFRRLPGAGGRGMVHAVDQRIRVAGDGVDEHLADVRRVLGLGHLLGKQRPRDLLHFGLDADLGEVRLHQQREALLQRHLADPGELEVEVLRLVLAVGEIFLRRVEVALVGVGRRQRAEHADRQRAGRPGCLARPCR